MRRLGLFASLVLLPLTPVPASGADNPVTASAFEVTLITGDRVAVSAAAGSRPEIRVTPARWPGRRVTFHTTYDGGSVRVVPSDVTGKGLDPNLFDVRALREAGGLRVITTGPGEGKRLPSIGARVTELSLKDAVALGASLARSQGPQHIWLDAVASAHTAAGLDRNLRRIEAPAAWTQGLSGLGVRVAVLDTGVDATHPDLAGRVEKAENFSDSDTVTDRNGHGTHVASIVAGSGAAAGGARQGVAFGAKLLSGKVLGDNGSGRLSDIISGMEWAAALGARVVNMSLGTDAPSDGTDPVSLAVERLTAAHGTLFVVSAGNRGPAPGSIGSPAAAPSALTVGAVDAHDRLAGFSSRGPRAGDRGIKPELVAPGVDIIAAMASGTDLGTPIGRHYTSLSGTSMAAPHVAGAAALLAQQRPQWTGKELKALLVGTASPLREGPFEVGSGRLDIARALPQQVIAPEPVLGFGFVAYPPSPAAPRTLTLRNTGDTPVTVDLAARLAGLQVTAEPRTLRLPAGGEAAATVTVDVRPQAYGAIGGAVRAGRLTIPLGIFKEPVHHVVHLKALDRLGTANVETLAWLVNLDDISLSPAEPVLLTGGAATARVRPGRYTVTAAIPTIEDGDPPPEDVPVITSVSIATAAEVPVDAETSVTLDARRAKPISARVAGVETTPVDLNVFVAAQDRADRGSVLAYQTSAQDVVEGKLFIEPTLPVRRGNLELSSKWRLSTPDGGSYDLLFHGSSFPADPAYVVDPSDLTRVNTTYRAPGSPIGYQEGRFVYTDVNPVSVATLQPGPAGGTTRLEYVGGRTPMRWFQCVTVLAGEEGIGGYCQAPQDLRPREAVARDWLRAPLRTRAGGFRQERQLFLGIDELADAAGNAGSVAGYVFPQRSYSLYRNGVLLGSGLDPLGGHAVPRGPAVFRLDRDLTLRPGLMALSTKIASSWTFTDPAEMVEVAVQAPVDAFGHVPRRSSWELTGPGRVTLELSYDDGVTWHPVRLDPIGRDRYRATADLPAGAVSLRTSASVSHTSSARQTVIGAFVAS